MLTSPPDYAQPALETALWAFVQYQSPVIQSRFNNANADVRENARN